MNKPEVTQASRENRRLLFIDDEQTVAEALKGVLELLDYQVETCNSFDVALAAIAGFKPQVVLVDLRLGPDNGLDLIKLIKETSPEIICILMTGYADTDSAIDAIRCGAYDYLRKPIKVDKLTVVLDRCFDRLQVEIEKKISEEADRNNNELLAKLVEIQTRQLEKEVTDRKASDEYAAKIHNEFSLLESYKEATEEALNRMPTGVVLVNTTGQVVFVNKLAENIILAKDGFTIGIDNLCRARSSGETEQLHNHIASATETRDKQDHSLGGVMSLTRPSLKRDYQIRVASLRSDEYNLEQERPAAAIFIADPETKCEPSVNDIAQLMGLTRAESRVVSDLLTGSTVKQTAKQLDLTEGTVRFYLQSIYQKTDTRGQSDLMRVVLSGLRINDMEH